MFAGLRPSEPERIGWAAIKWDLKRIDLGALHTKTRERRLVTIRPVLEAWLAPYRRRRRKITRKNWIKRTQKLRAAFGGKWPHDVLRHSWITYELALSGDVKATVMQSGHTEETLFRHYREVVGPEIAREFFALTPDTCRETA